MGILVFILITVLFLFLGSIFIYLLPWLFLAWLILAVLDWFATRRRRQQLEAALKQQYGDYYKAEKTYQEPVNARAPREDSIDVEFTESEPEELKITVKEDDSEHDKTTT